MERSIATVPRFCDILVKWKLKECKTLRSLQLLETKVWRHAHVFERFPRMFFSLAPVQTTLPGGLG